jgi:heme/copper-type cytochrome/quinol oxidase subunit 3
MANIGLVVGGILITVFSLAFLNPLFKIPSLAEYQGPLLAKDSFEWTIAAIMTFVVVFLTGSVMMAKGFLEKKVQVKSQKQYELETTQAA